MTFDRRLFLLSSAAALAASCARASAAGNPALIPGNPDIKATPAQLNALGKKNEAAFASDPVRKLTDADWKKKLPSDAYQILRHEGTEAPNTSPLLNEHRAGKFVCLGCGLPVFESKTKFDSGTGWPSFTDFIPGSLGFKADFLLGYERDEYHCAKCLGHLGHRFTDGPAPTGLRYCTDGAATKFVPA